MDATGASPLYINPVHSIMPSGHELTLTMRATYNWRVKMTAGARDKNRICASYDGKKKVSRLNPMLPLVARLILAQGPAKIWAQIQAKRAAKPKSDQQSNQPSPTSPS